VYEYNSLVHIMVFGNQVINIIIIIAVTRIILMIIQEKGV